MREVVVVPIDPASTVIAALDRAGLTCRGSEGEHTYGPTLEVFTHATLDGEVRLRRDEPVVLFVRGEGALLERVRATVAHVTLEEVRERLAHDARVQRVWVQRAGPLLGDAVDAALERRLVDLLEHPEADMRCAVVLAMGDAGRRASWHQRLASAYDDEEDDVVAAWMGEVLTAWGPT